jgi:hypothetical protein
MANDKSWISVFLQATLVSFPPLGRLFLALGTLTTFLAASLFILWLSNTFPRLKAAYWGFLALFGFALISLALADYFWQDRDPGMAFLPGDVRHHIWHTRCKCFWAGFFLLLGVALLGLALQIIHSQLPLILTALAEQPSPG